MLSHNDFIYNIDSFLPTSLQAAAAVTLPPQQTTAPQQQQQAAAAGSAVNTKLPTYNNTSAIGASIKQITEEVRQEGATKEKVEILASEEEAYTEDDFRKLWREYAQSLNERVVLSNTMLNSMINFGDGLDVEIVVANVGEEKELVNERPDLRSFLSQRLRNSKVNYHVRVGKSGENRQLMSDKERFAEMLKRNKDLEVLRNTLHLELV